jgi:hypothetical protein
MSELEEWAALVTEALQIQESDEDKERRLGQLARDIVRSDGLTAVESSELIVRIQTAVVDGRR